MSAQALILILHLLLAVFYLPLIITLYKRHTGQETPAMILVGYVVLGALLTATEGLW